MSILLTISEASKVLGVSRKTLMRWEIKNYFCPYRDEHTNYRFYDSDKVAYMKILLEIDRRYKKHLKPYTKLLAELNSIRIEQDVISGQKLRLITEDELKRHEVALIAFDRWESKHQKLLDGLMKFPRSMLLTTTEDY